MLKITVSKISANFFFGKKFENFGHFFHILENKKHLQNFEIFSKILNCNKLPKFGKCANVLKFSNFLKFLKLIIGVLDFFQNIWYFGRFSPQNFEISKKRWNFGFVFSKTWRKFGIFEDFFLKISKSDDVKKSQHLF